MIDYFVSYNISFSNGSFGFGNMHVKVRSKITDLDRIQEIEKMISEEKGGKAIVINWRTFDEE